MVQSSNKAKSPNSSGMEKKIDLWSAIKSGNVLAIREWVKSHGGNNLLDQYNEKGFTPLHYAIIHGKIGTVVEILSSNIDIIEVTEKKLGLTPLMIAAFLGKVNCVEILLEYGADCDKISKKGKTAYDCAAQTRKGKLPDAITKIQSMIKSAIDEKETKDKKVEELAEKEEDLTKKKAAELARKKEAAELAKKKAAELAKKKEAAELARKKEAAELARKKKEAAELARKKKEAAELARKKEAAELAKKKAAELAKKKAAELAKKKEAAELARKKEAAELARKKKEAAELARKKKEAEFAKKEKEAELAKKKEAAELARKKKEAAELAKKEKEAQELAKQEETGKNLDNDNIQEDKNDLEEIGKHFSGILDSAKNLGNKATQRAKDYWNGKLVMPEELDKQNTIADEQAGISQNNNQEQTIADEEFAMLQNNQEQEENSSDTEKKSWMDMTPREMGQSFSEYMNSGNDQQEGEPDKFKDFLLEEYAP